MPKISLRNRFNNAVSGFRNPHQKFAISQREIDSLVDYFKEIKGISISEITAYTTLETAYRCIKIICDRISKLPMLIYKEVSDAIDEIYYQTPYDILKRPNPVMIGRDLIVQTIGWLMCKGCAYWWIPQTQDKKKTIWIIPSTQIYPVDSNKYPPDAYQITTTQETIRKEELIIFKFWNPVGQNLSLAPMTPALTSANLDTKIIKLNQSIFDNAGLVSGVLTTKENPDPEDLKKLIELWKSQYAGVDKAGRIPILTGGFEFQKFGMTLVDLENILSRKYNRENMGTALGIPPGEYGNLDHAYYSNMKEQRRILWEDTLEPLIMQIEDVITEFYLKRFREDLYLKFDISKDSIVQEMKRDAWIVHKEQMQSGVMTPNQYIVNELNGQPVPWGDRFYGQATIMPLGTLEGTDQALYGKKITYQSEGLSKLFPSLQKQLPDKKETKIITLNKRRAIVPANPLSEEQRTILWRKFDLILQSQENRFKKEVTKLMKEQLKKTIDKFKDAYKYYSSITKDLTDDIFDIDEWIAYFNRTLRPLYYVYLRQAGQDALIDVGSDMAINMAQAGIMDFLDKYVTNTLREIQGYTKEQIAEAITEGIKNGESITEIELRITNGFGIDYRSERIARTETLRANNKGHMLGYEQSGVVEGKEWLGTIDDRIRDTHKQADGQVVLLNEFFIVGGEQLQFPGDPNGSAENTINCRCRTLPVLKEQ